MANYNDVIQARGAYHQALREFIHLHYGEDMPKNLTWNDYELLLGMMGCNDWNDVPDPERADSEFVKDELHGMQTYLYHQEEGCYI